jgi:hypothetical protein
MGRKLGIYPHIWMSGPDHIDHKLYTDCQRARAQAWYRGEQWFITEKEYIEMWRKDDRYLMKGRHADAICMTKIDYDLPWTVDNVEFISRREHFRQCSHRRHSSA